MKKPPFISLKQRAAIKARLVELWKAGRETSGTVSVASLAFSSVPAKWSIMANVLPGEPYMPGMLVRADVAIRAVLSYCWLETTTAIHIPMTGNVFRKPSEIIAGICEITPPDGIDRLELITCSATEHARRQLKTQRLFRFTKSGFTAITKLPVHHHSQAKVAVRLAQKEFNQLLAAHVAERLNPKKNPQNAISDWAENNAIAQTPPDSGTKKP